MSLRKYYWQNRIVFLAVILFAILIPLSNVHVVDAQADAEVLSQIQGYPTDVQVGETFTFFILYRCASSTNDCGEISIDVSFPDLLDVIDVDTGNADIESTVTGDDPVDDTGTDGIILSMFTDLAPPNAILCDNSADDVCFTAGQTGIATITARVHGEGYYQTFPPEIPIEVDSTANDPSGGPTTTTTTGTTTITEPEAQYTVSKVRTDTPESAADPIPGNNVTYQITITPSTQQNNLALNNITLTDTLPPNTVFVSASDGGTESGGVVTWTGLSTSFNASDQIDPITVTVTVNYPTSDFSTDEDPQPGTATSVTNDANFTADEAQTGNGACPSPNCPGTGSNTHGFDPPTANPDVNKSILSNPVGAEGTGRYNLSVDNTLANVGVSNVSLTDVLPTDGDIGNDVPASTNAENDLPLELEAITVGERDADILVSTLITCDATSPDTDFTTLTGGPFTAGSTLNATTHPVDLAAGNTIKCIRWAWTDTDLNAGESISGMQILFTPRFTDADNDNNNDSGFGIPALGSSYTNCISFDFDGPDPADVTLNPPIIARSTSDCDDVDVAGSVDNVSLASTKGGDAEVIPDDSITFDLTYTLTERSSQTLLSPVIVEALPLEFDASTLVWEVVDPDDDLTPAQEAAITLTGPTAQTVPDGLGGTETRNVFVWELPDNLDPLENDSVDFTIRVTVDLFPYIQTGTYSNVSYYLSDNPDGDLICETGILLQDTEDVDGDGDINEDLCLVSYDYNVPSTAILEGQKWVRNETNPLPAIDVINDPAEACDVGFTVSNGSANGITDENSVDNDFSRFQCVSEGIPGDSFTYSLTIRNTGNANLEDYTQIDILPYPGDTEVLPRAGGVLVDRDSEWRPYLIPNGITIDDLSTDPVLATVPNPPTITGTPIDDNTDVTIEYSTQTNPCRPEVATVSGCQPADWTFTPVTADDWKRVQSFRITANAGIVLRPGDQLEITVEMEIPTDSPPNETTGLPDDSLVPQAGDIIWNSYAHVGTTETTGVTLLSAEPIKVGIRIPETVSVGNRVWIDTNNSGDIDGAEAGIENVTVSMYEWDGTNPTTLVDTTTTDANGYYIFNLIPDGIDPNGIYAGIPIYDPDQDYVIVVDETNFDLGNPLQDYVNSTGNTDPNNEDDADDTFVPGFGYVSSDFQLDPNQEDTADETEVNGTLPTTNDDPVANADFGALGRGSLGQDDDNSDLRKDFGFWQPMSIGNKVWLDTGALTNNGIEEVDEVGVADVTLSLYLDDDADGVPDSTTPISTTITDDNGYYLFDQLTPGTYLVGVDTSNFDDPTDPLFGYEDSDLNDSTDEDQNDNGQTDTFQLNFGELSGPIVLEYTTEPTLNASPLLGEADQTIPNLASGGDANYDVRDPNIPPDPDPARTEYGRYGALDNNSNLTVDFGFWRPEFALGNFVWDDIDNDSQYDATEVGIGDVVVNLYRDLDEDGTPDGGIIATTTTSNGGSGEVIGYYHFDGLEAGGYIVELDPVNWAGGNPLENYISSTRNESIDGVTAAGPPPYNFPDDWDDQFDDGRNRDSYADLSGAGFTGTSYVVSGIRSETVTLVPESEAPGTENADLPPNTDPDPTDGDTTEPHVDTNIGAGGRDFNSDLTVDFGVYIPLSVGNRIWLDNYEDPSIGKRAGDGVFDEADGEAGIQGVEVWLYKLDDGGDVNDVNDYSRVPVALDVNATTLTNDIDTTDASGYYLFDGLGEGIYRVRVPFTNFFAGNVLEDFISSNGINGVATNNSGDADDNRDSGIDSINRDPTLDGTWSDQIVLTRDSEPTTGVDESTDINPETDGSLATYDGPLGIGLFNEDDDNSDLTVDFGFFRPLSLGNRVWFDPDGDGDIGGTENGIDGVTVQLFQDDGTGTFVQVAEVVTANGGYYRFDGLQPDDYQVRIPEDEFQAGGTLEQYISSQPTETDPNTDGDSNDNGIDNDDPSVGGISSGTVSLSYDNEPTDDTDEPIGGYDDVSINPNTSTAGAGAPGAENDDQNLSVDFGFLKPFSLGNRVWYDYDADGIMDITGNDGDAGDGYSGEVGVQGVTVNLYDAADLATILSTVYTDAEGYYRFDNLMPGDYVVEIPASEFLLADDDDDGDTIADDAGELYQYASSLDALNGVGLSPENGGTAASDVDDNGVDPATYGLSVFSQTVTLGPDVLDPTTVVEPDGDDDEPVTYAAISIDPDNAIPVYDTRSNTTVDFGFYPYYSLGNRVWFDDDNDGVLDPTETGVPGATVNLYIDADRDGVVDIDGTENTPFLTVTTSVTGGEEGFYRFDMLPAGNYIVEVDAGNFATGTDPLFNYVSSFGFDETAAAGADGNVNHDDDGRDPNSPAVPATDGVRSTQITIGLDSPTGIPEQDPASFEPTGELLEGGVGTDAQPSGYEAAAVEPDGITEPEDRRENATVDFGFFRPLSLGNRVWIDFNGDGLIDVGEPGLDGVTVNLLDSTGVPVLDNTGNPYTAVTDNDGYYRFNGLQEGSYIVEIPTEEFQVDGDGAGDDGELLGYISTEITEVDPNETAPGTDSDDNGLNVDDPSTNADGVRSGVVVLSYDGEPTGETDVPAGTPPDYGTGAFIDSDVEPTDADENLTVDFGFIRPFSLGNRVWYDYDADGIMDITGNDGDAGDGYSGEVGVQGVTVNLYNNAAPTVIVSTVYTDAEGYYRFDNLMPGDYFVEIPASEFLLAADDDDGDTIADDAGELYQFASSLDALNGVGLDPDADTSDFDDNGVDPVTYGDAVRSQVVTLGPDSLGVGSEPTTDGDEPVSYAAISIDPDAATAVSDDHSDTTLDFGFFPYYSLGNRVWFDDNDGVLEATEVGVPGVLVNLYIDADRDGVVDIDGTENTPFLSVTTSVTGGEEGFYRFDMLPAGNYIVEIDASNFVGATDPLFEYVSSFGFDETAAAGADGNVNHDDDGRDLNDPVNPAVDGVRSGQITLGLDSPTGIPEQDPASFEPTGELLEGGVGTDAQPSGYEVAAVEPDGITEPEDRRENATVDFGFYRPLSLGNRIWIDFNGDGLIDVGEPGVDGVTVNLLDGTGAPYLDSLGNPYTAVTDNGGYYRFDGLNEGDYIVEIPTEEFQVDGDGAGDDGELLGYISTEITEVDPDETAPGTDSDDNGLNVDDPSTNADGVRSGVVTLNYGAEPTGETDEPTGTPPDYGTGFYPDSNLGDVPDLNENLTVDFGFIRPFSLGNRVWLDYDADGIMDITGNDGDAGDGYSGEVGIAGVSVNLYNNAAPTVIVSTVYTDAEGYYRFDNLMPGDYFVEIPASEFLLAADDDDGDTIADDAGELYQFASSLDALNGVGLDPDADTSDFDDNGVDPVTYGDAVRSQVVTLGPDSLGVGSEPTTDTDEPVSYAAISIDPDAATAVSDDHSDTTIDFGFFPYYSLGNRVWFDDDNEGDLEATEEGVPNVLLNLYFDSNRDGVVDIDGAENTVFRTVTTSATVGEEGFYRFDLLPAGNYIVEVAASNFVGATDPLFRYVSSFGFDEAGAAGANGNVNHDDDGRDPNSPAAPITDGVRSGQITLGLDSPTGIPEQDPASFEPTGELLEGGVGTDAQPSGYEAAAVDPDGITEPEDRRENATVDFGFYRQLALGNRIWIDFNGNGVIDTGEPGVDGVTVNLLDNTGAPYLDFAGTPYTAVTDEGGYYRFEGLVPGDYIVEIPTEEFQVDGDGAGDDGELLGYISTEITQVDPDETAPGTDSDDNGLNVDDPATNADGVRSGLITLDYATEPTGETDDPADYDTGVFPVTNVGRARDEDENLTVDFGFIRPFSIGNRVWLDYDADGIMDITGNDGDAGDGYSAEVGIPGVSVNLYNNVSPTVIVSTVFTDANGYYRFDNLMPGDYFVEIPATEFLLAADDDDGDTVADDAGELYQLASSNDAANGVGLDPDADDSDFDDNGVDPATYGDAVRSQVVTLGPDSLATGNEPTNDDDEPVSYAAISIDPDAATAPDDSHTNTTLDFGFFPYGSLGNYVWEDVNNNNTFDTGEIGLGGVTVNLYYDRDGDGVVNLALTGAGQDGEVYSTVTTSETGVNGATEDGYYRFDLLPAGEYIVEIPNTNFDGAADPLFGYTSSNSVAEDDPDTGGTAASDIDDNGVDPLVSSTLPEPRVDGVFSDPVTLNIGTDTFAFGTAYNEPSGETEPGDYGTDAVDPDGITRPADDSENLTVDFGFFQPLSIGNRVWFDDDAEGDLDATEIGVAGVTVILFDSGGTEIDRVETDTDGYYRFDNLIPGDYYVEIPNTEFVGAGELVGYLSSPQPAADPDTDPSDLDDNGISDPLTDDFATNGIRSEVITLEAVSSEPTGEDEPADGGDADLMPDYGAGSFTGAQAVDNRANLTVDFGFFKPMSLGNRVWYDRNADGDDLDGEAPVAGVSVELYRFGVGRDGVTGTADDNTALYTVITDSEGYYRFDSLPPGDYVVTIPGSNFGTGQALENYVSSARFGTDPTVADPDDVAPGTDRDDNGINATNNADRLANGVSSGTVTLEAVDHSLVGNEPTAEVEPASYGAGSTAPTVGFDAEDARSNLTVDFGFYIPMAIGNRVFNDDGSGTGGIINDGIQNGTEPGIDGVTLTLYTNNAGAPGTPISTTTTQDNGYYIFDGLPEGEYIVVVDATNFDPGGELEDTFSSFFVPTGNDTDTGIDLNDNGVDDDFPSVNGIQSTVITLVIDDEPSGTNAPDDTDIPTAGTLANEGRNGELDSNSDMTVDFGFPTPPMSIGNFVWYDLNNNGVVDAGENPVVPVGGQDIIVDLYRDDNTDGLPDDINTDGQITNADRISTTVLDSNGFYLFDRLDTGAYLTAGNYIVGLNFVNFRTGQILEDYYSSTTTEADPNTDGDQNDNGIDRLDANDSIFSSTITLSPEDEPINETPLSNNAADHGPEFIGRDGQRDTNSNVTVDFGLYKPMSIGNRVWYDNNDDGLIDTGVEDGIPGVQVTLLDGVGTPITTTTTDANGYYLFDNLTPGTYQVRIDPVNWTDGTGILDDLPSSTTNNVTNPTAPNNTDSNDNGINAVDETDRETNGVLSDPIILALDSQPTSEGDRSLNPIDGPNFIGNNGESDNNSDITIDFGFVPPNMSIGNFVWVDTDNSGLLDGAEVGLDGVDVSLYRADAGGNPLGAALQTDITADGGFYLFDAVAPGQYVVIVESTNFAGGGVLENLISSQTGVASTEPNTTDTNDNGIDDADPATNGISSALIDLQRDNAPTLEDDLGPDGIGLADGDNNSDLTIDFGFYQPMSLGNRVWFDTDDNGQLDATEVGVGDVIINLYDAADLTTPISTTTTDSNGYYLFDGLTPGDYVVEIPASEFGNGEPLEATVSSGTETPGTDDRDNGSNEVDPTVTPTRSGTITLELNNEPTGESEGPDGRGSNGETDNSSDLTVDFGFVPQDTYSVGNRVWIDDNRDGDRDAAELGVGSVLMNLYLDADADGTPDSTTPIATTTTDADGYYIFDNLTANTYIVGIDPSNFTSGPLLGYASTIPGNVSGTDDDDNRAQPAVDETFDVTLGIYSDSIQLSSGDEPTSEGDIDPDGTNSAPDGNSDLTIDFGFVQGLSLGNHVWFDSNNDGLQDAGEPGIANVTITLYTFISGTGLGPAVATDTTDGNGYYLFNNLEPGDYVVVVDDTNFAAAGPLFNYDSSPDPADPDGDLNDNGIDDPDPLNNGGIESNVITLAYDNTPTGETDTSGDTDDGPNFRGINNEADNNSDLTVDFGFFTSTMSLGNYVWLDDGVGGGVANNGEIDGTEAGIAGVELELYSAISSGQPIGSAVQTTTTDTEGYYLFDNVPPGNYVVLVVPSNFDVGAPLENLLSSAGSDGGTDDIDDNGIDDNQADTNGILSELITLQSDSAPTTEDPSNISSDTTAYGPNGRGLSDPSDENSDLTIDFGFSAQYDWGDNPDGTTFNSGTVTGNYGTVSGSNGANHRIVSSLYIGQIVDAETGTLENDSATADDDDPSGSDDEDGVVIPALVAGATVDIEVTVFNNTGSDANLIGWIDWNLDGDFDPEEAIPNQLPVADPSGLVVEYAGSPIVIPSSNVEQVVQISVTVPLNSNAEDTDLSDGNDIFTFSRFRLTTDPIDENDPTGPASDGEVEDYRVQVEPPGLSIVKTDGANSIVVGESTTYTITITNSGADVFNQNFFDDIPVADPDGYDPDSVQWTCEADDNASCIAGDAPGTDIDTIQTTTTIDQDIDIQSGGEVVFTITATLRDNHVAATISNTASLQGGPSSTDENGVIYDPPVGVKSGVLSGSTITWTMTWLNTGGDQAATITDPIGNGQTFAGNLVCTEFGTSTGSCSYSAAQDAVIWTGTIGTGNPNRVEITFDVTISGNGNYSNTATIDLGGDTATAAASVRVGSDDDDDDDNNVGDGGSGYTNAAPLLFKTVDTPFTLPGATVVWTIEAVNDTNNTITTVSVIDEVPDSLTITDTSSSSGDIEVSGQTVTLTQGSLAPGETITITVTTDVSSDVAIPFAINNPASLTCDCTESRNAIATIISVLELPATGETPLWRTLLLLMGMTGIGMGSLLVVRRIYLR